MRIITISYLNLNCYFVQPSFSIQAIYFVGLPRFKLPYVNEPTRSCCNVESTSLTLIQHRNVVCPVGNVNDNLVPVYCQDMSVNLHKGY